MERDGDDADLLNDGFEPPLRAHQCDGSYYFSVEHSEGPVLQHRKAKSTTTILLRRHIDRCTFAEYHGEGPANTVLVSSGRTVHAGWCCSVLKNKLHNL